MKDSTKAEQNSGKVYGRALPISHKKSILLANFLRGKSLNASRTLLEKVIGHKTAVPYTKFARGGTGHKKNIGPGRYPEKTCGEFLKLIKAAEANAQQKGMDASKLYISAIITNKGATTWHYGRKRRRQIKMTHVELIVKEKEAKEKKERGKKSHQNFP